MACLLCTWLSERLCPEGLWYQSSRWEQHASNDWELWEGEDEATRARIEQASEVFETDPARALELRRELAEGGASLAMRQAGRQYEYGHGTKRDLALAEHWYYEAVLAGAWLATLQLAGLRYRHRLDADWEGILEDGVERGFLPAGFWLAVYRYKRRPRRSTARAVLPLMRRVADAGHPGARLVLAKWKMLGRFGLGAIREGVRELRAVMRDYPCDGPEETAEDSGG